MGVGVVVVVVVAKSFFDEAVLKRIPSSSYLVSSLNLGPI